MRDRLKNNFYSPSKFDEINIAKLRQSGEFSGIFRISLVYKSNLLLNLHIKKFKAILAGGKDCSNFDVNMKNCFCFAKRMKR